MAITETDKIDMIGVEPESGEVVLAMTDHLPWEVSETQEHLLLIQEKVNSYLLFIESGELVRTYPDAKGKPIVISLMQKYSPNKDANEFFRNVTKLLADVGIEFRFQVFSSV